MNRSIRFILVVFLFLGREISPQIVEEYAESVGESSEANEFLDRLNELKKNPVNLNLASVDELVRLPWLTPFMAGNIVQYRKTVGRIQHLSELESLTGFDSGLIERIGEFVVIGLPKRPERKLIVEARSRLKVPPEPERSYLGDCRKLYTRVGVSAQERYSIGFLAEKDSYEESYTDFISYFAQLTGSTVLRKVVAGHYGLEFGEGLMFAPVGFPGKSHGTIKKGNRGILRARSSNENSSLLGGALVLTLKDTNLFGFFSSRSLDATLNEDGTAKNLYESGLHRTETELQKKDVLTEKLIGGRLETRGKSVGSGLTLCRGEYSRSFAGPDFSGSKYTLIGVDFEGRLRKTRIFGEAAYSTSGGIGALLGMRLSVHRFSTGLLLRNYTHDFWSPHSSGFSEYDDNNERGAYCFTTFSTKNGTKLEAYSDIFETIRPTEPGEFPRAGREYQVSWHQKISKALKSQVRYKKKVKSNKLRESLRFQFDAENDKLRLRVRAEFSNSRDGKEGERNRGDLEYFGLRYKPRNWIEMEGRICLFSIESYDARIYTYERDLPGYLRNVALSGDGTRSYLLFRYIPKPWLEIILKYANERKERIREEFGLQLDVSNSF